MQGQFEAIKLMKKAWGEIEARELEETEIIDIRPEYDLTSTWSPFIHSHHYSIRTLFYDSYMARHPRRSCEALWEQLMEARFIEGADFPKDKNFASLYDWLSRELMSSKKRRFPETEIASLIRCTG